MVAIIAVIFLTINRQKKAHVQKTDISLILYNMKIEGITYNASLR